MPLRDAIYYGRITQFNMEDALEVRGEEKFQEGWDSGHAEGEAAG